MKINMPLRVRVTVINTAVLILCTLIITIGNGYSSAKTLDATIASPLEDQGLIVGNSENIYPYDYSNQEAQMQAQIEAVEVAKESNRKMSVFYMISVIFIGAIISYLTTGKSLKSVQRLSNEIKDISEYNLSKKINEEGPKDEIKELTKSFNNMLTRIDSAFESQKEFSSNVAHELRTPLAVIKMKIDVFKKKEEHSKEEYGNLIEVLERNNNRLSKVVNELLSICNKDVVEFKEKINFTKMIESIINELNEVALKENIILTPNESTNNEINIDFYGNEQLLYRAIYNLIENGIKYNKTNGEVKIDFMKTNNLITLSISDTGYGIKEDDYEKIFKPFYRIDKSRSRKIGGSGLGLSIVKTIIEQHNGRIKVESNEGGSKFIVEIPYKILLKK